MDYHPFLLCCMSQPLLPFTTDSCQTCQKRSAIPFTFSSFWGTSVPCIWIPNTCYTLICNLTKGYLLDLPSAATPRELTFEKNCYYFSIIFFPGILPSNALKNTSILLHTLTLSPLFATQCSLLLSLLTSDYLQLPSPLVRQSLDTLAASNGSLSIQQLAQHVSYSERHIRRLLESSFSYPPKMLNRILRFQHSLQELLKMPNRNNSEFIQFLAYSDQAHFQREFKTFTEMTPRRFIQFIGQNRLLSSIEPVQEA